jgi:hypothetical protein
MHASGYMHLVAVDAGHVYTTECEPAYGSVREGTVLRKRAKGEDVRSSLRA